MLQKINKIINAVRKKSKLIDKQQILKKFINDDELKKFLEYCYSPYKNYNISIRDLEKNSDLNELEFYNNIFEICDLLNTKKIIGNKAISIVNGFISQHIQYKELLMNFFNRNLKLNLSIQELNIIFHNIIPVFSVPIIDKYEESKKTEYNLDKYCIEQKLSGVHVLTFIRYNNGKIICNCVSSKNKEFFTLDKIKNEIIERYKKSLYYGKDIILEGNICIIEEDKHENWDRIKTDILKKNFTIQHPKYVCYDILLLDEFKCLKQSMNYDIRYRNLKQFISISNKGSNYITYLFAAPFTDANLELLKKTYIDTEKWDGLIFRKFLPYRPYNHNELLEYSIFETDIVEVKKLEHTIKIINGKEQPCIKNLIIIHNFNEVHFCNGITDEQLILWCNHPELIIDKKILIRYKKLTNYQYTDYKFIDIFDSKKIQK